MTPAERDAGFMRAALGLARRGLGRVWPNPSVGCVVVSPAGVVLGRGVTGASGRPHAETLALAQAGAEARGATAYITLEPCAHVGRTPPCAEALIAAGIARAVVSIADPDARVNGAGIARLRAAGVAVETGALAAEASDLAAGFLTRVRTGRPRLTLKLATTLDGRIATAAGESRWITGPAARRAVHLMRAQADAVLIGAGTARADDPALTVRDLGLAAANPVRIVVSGALSVARGSRLGRSATEAPLWLCHHGEAEADRIAAWREIGAETLEIPFDADGQLDLGAMFRLFGARGLTRVLCEGGGRLAAALIGADLVDEIVAFTAGRALGDEGTPAIGGLGIAALDSAPHYRLVETSAVGGDIRSRWERDGTGSGAGPG